MCCEQAYVSICQHTSAYVSIRQHTSAYAVSMLTFETDHSLLYMLTHADYRDASRALALQLSAWIH